MKLYPPRARVIHAPSSGPERRGLVVSRLTFGELPDTAHADVELKDVEAYVVRFRSGERITVPANEIRQNKYAR